MVLYNFGRPFLSQTLMYASFTRLKIIRSKLLTWTDLIQNKHWIRNSYNFPRRHSCVFLNNISRLNYSTGISDEPKPDSKLTSEANELLTLNRPLSHSEWEEIESSSLKKGLEAIVFESRVMGVCMNNKNVEAAKSFINYFKKLGREPNVLSLSRYMRICGSVGENIDEEAIISTYHLLRERSEEVDSSILTHMIHGLARTRLWTDCLKLLEDYEKLNVPNPHLYNAICNSAFLHNNRELGYNLLMKMAEKNMVLSGHSFIAWIQCYQSLNTNSNSLDYLNEFLDYCRKCLIYLPEKVVENFKIWYLSMNSGEWQYDYVDIPFSGICPNCQTALESNTLTKEEFEFLRSTLINRFVNGDDKYFKIHPKDYEELKKSIQNYFPYDVVVDAFSVVNYQKQKSLDARINQIWSVLSALLNDKEEKILVIAPEFMSQWKSKNMNYIRRKTKWVFLQGSFLTSQIIAALYGGNNTKIVCNNFLDDYKYNVSEHHLTSLFKRWKLSHVISFQQAYFGEKIEFLPNITFNPVIQRTESTIHVPCTNHKGPVIGTKLPTKWLCMKTDSSAGNNLITQKSRKKRTQIVSS